MVMRELNSRPPDRSSMWSLWYSKVGLGCDRSSHHDHGAPEQMYQTGRHTCSWSSCSRPADMESAGWRLGEALGQRLLGLRAMTKHCSNPSMASKWLGDLPLLSSSPSTQSSSNAVAGLSEVSPGRSMSQLVPACKSVYAEAAPRVEPFGGARLGEILARGTLSQLAMSSVAFRRLTEQGRRLVSG